MSVRLVIFEHVDWERPGKLLEKNLAARGVERRVIRVWEEAIPELTAYDGLIILGGPPNVHEEDKYPFLRREKELIREWLKTAKPCLGFCLGHQLLGDALGAEIGPNPMLSVGVIDSTLTEAGRAHPIFRGLKNGFKLFKWHGQAVKTPLPQGLELLAYSDQCAVEAFSVVGRPQIIGVQSDNHAADPDDVKRWVAHDRDWLAGLPNGRGTDGSIVREAEADREILAFEFQLFINNFLDCVEAAVSSCCR